MIFNILRKIFVAGIFGPGDGLCHMPAHCQLPKEMATSVGARQQLLQQISHITNSENAPHICFSITFFGPTREQLCVFMY